jgi:hypothetical protein
VKVLAILSALAIALTGILEQVNSGPSNGSGPFGLPQVLEVLRGVSFIFVIVGWYMGASFVGAEWAAGTMATLITWESRRTRVLAVKAIAAVAAVFVFMTLVCGSLAAVLALVASTHDAGAHSRLLDDLVWLVLRVAAASALAGLLGFCIATVARHTAGAIGIGFGYLGIVEGLLRAWRPGWQRLLLGENLVYWVIGRGYTDSGHTVTLAGAGLVLVGYGAILFAVALAWFRARDVN